jgi:hypothetical protein
VLGLLERHGWQSTPRAQKADDTKTDLRSRAVDTALAAEAYAERVETASAWRVVEDAWEEAGRPELAHYALARRVLVDKQPSDLSPILTFQEAEEIRTRLRSEFDRPSRIHLSRFEVYNFLRTQPDQLFAYYDAGFARIRTAGGDFLGLVTKKSKPFRPFYPGRRRVRSDRLVRRVLVRGINGYWYNGTCDIEAGNFCHLDRAAPWIVR